MESSSSVLLSTASDEAAKTTQFFRRDFGGFPTKQSGDSVFDRTFKKRVDEMTQGRAASDVAWDGRDVDVAEAIFLVVNMAFFLQDAELCADGGVMRLAGHAGEDFGDSGAFKFVEKVHDLALAAAENWRA